MAPGRKGRKGKEIVQESEAPNVRGLDETEWERRGRRPRSEARNVNVELEVDQLTRGIGEMELVISRFQNMRPPRFFGNEDGEKVVAWLKSMKRLFSMLEYTPDLQLKLAICQLKDRAQLWWETTEEALKESGERVTWDVFCAQFAREYSPPSYYSAKEAEFNRLTQGNMTVVEYASQFSALLAYVPHVASSDRNKLSHFMQGLNRTICTLVVAGAPINYADAVEKAKNVEASLLLTEPQSFQPGFPQSFGGNVPMPVGALLYRPLLPYQPSQSYQQPKQQHFKAKGKQFKKQTRSSSSSSGSQRGGSVGSPVGVFCDRCGGKHISTQCTGVHGSCNICGQFGHYARECSNAARQQFQQPQFCQGFRGPATRLFVPTQSFQQSSYPQPKGSVSQRFPGPQQAQVHALTQDQVQDALGGVIAGICLIFNHPAILIDTGASNSFVSVVFVDEHEIATTPLIDTVSVSTPAGVCLMSHEIIMNCVIRFDDNIMITNLIKLDMSDFDCILGMDPLSNSRATVDCFHGVVRFRPYYDSKWNFYVDATQGKGFEVSDIPVVKEFSDVFPDEIPGFPSQRKIDFSIELVSGTNPISRAPYRLAPAPDLNMRQRRWMELLKDFDFHEHLGTSGWTYQISGDYFVVSSIQVEPQILSIIKAAQRTDPHIHRLKELSRTGQTEKFSVASGGSLCFNGRLVVHNLIDLKEAILREAHCSRHTIHPGIRKMYHTLRAHYLWEVSDRDPRFAAKFWGSLQSALGSKLAMSTAYHPQIDGQSERTIQTLEDMLRAVVMDFKGGWQESLSLVEFSYNNSFQATIGMAPFEAL
ncbi:uncharacterized protein [Primulina huaijiensis]|uniref:uncharacterized protein n=1 Tax=Primulina huaijiensis TaxID=1492673 RepID=UPI003CC6E96D